MQSKSKAIGIISRGFARNAKDEARLREVGIKTIYRQDKGEQIGKFQMRRNELLGVVDGLRAFGTARRDMVAAVKLVHGMGAAIVDAEYPELRSDRNGAAMLDKALAKFIPTPEQAAAMQEASVKARTKGRMADRTALAIWRNPKFSVHEAVALMTGWSQSAAYQKLGKRDVPAGRRPK